MSPSPPAVLIDAFGRRVTYLRLSITDRCDLRCVYCMAEDMQFLPRAQILSLEEIQRVAAAFVALGVEKIRVTGGEPLVRKGALDLLGELGGLPGLRELTLTTNGTQLQHCAAALKQAGVKRLNISLDTLDAQRFRQLTRVGDLATVLRGIDAAKQQGFERIKLNVVAMRGRNDDEVGDLTAYAVEHGLDIAFIEEMPLGLIDDHDRALAFYPSAEIRRDLAARFDLQAIEADSGGPARYWQVGGSTTRVGFISPHSENFCASCNRVRLTVEGRLLLCLGNEHSVDLKPVLREHPNDAAALKQAIVAAMALKPERHHFDLTADQPVIFRHMSVTGG